VRVHPVPKSAFLGEEGDAREHVYVCEMTYSKI